MPTSDFAQYGQIIWKRLWLIVLLVISTVGTVAAVSYTRPPYYRSTVRFQITALPPSDVTLFQATRGSGYNEEIAATRANFIDVLTSLDVAWETVDVLQLPMSGRELVDKVTTEEAVESDFVLLSVTAEDRQLAADIANTLISVAIKSYGELNARPLVLSQVFISSQLEQTVQELSEARAQLIAFQAAHNLGTLDGAIDAQVSIIRALELSHDEAIARNDDAQARAYGDLIEARQVELQELIQLSGQYDTLEARVGQLQGTYAFLLEKLTEARLKENQARNLDFVQVLGEARVPDQAENRLSVPILVLSAAAATGLGIMLAFALEYATRRRGAKAKASEGMARQYT
jgi:uncharacterized protein involved in exopolysaccharide biosynthesis